MWGIKTSKICALLIVGALGTRIYGFESTKILQNIRTMGTDLKNSMFINLKMSETQLFINFVKDGHRKMMKIHLMKSWESWTWDQYLSTDMKWKNGNGRWARKRHVFHICRHFDPFVNIVWHFVCKFCEFITLIFYLIALIRQL